MLQDTFSDWLGHVRDLAGGFKGLSAAIWTQLSDVEGEVNGIVSYDRKVRWSFLPNTGAPKQINFYARYPIAVRAVCLLTSMS